MFLDCKVTNKKICALYQSIGLIMFQDITLDEKVGTIKWVTPSLLKMTVT